MPKVEMTKDVTLYIELLPGWQDRPSSLDGAVWASTTPPAQSCGRLFAIKVSLPCFGGSADVESTQCVIPEEVKP